MLIFGGIIYCLWAAALSWWDIRQRRLPDWLTLPAAVLSLAVANWGGAWWPGMYLVLGRAHAGVGGGDIKLALPLGMLVGHVAGFMGVVAASGCACLLTLGWSVCTGQKKSPHGPAMLLAAAGVVVCVHPL
ncbi:A24 family peptidase [Corynebacterium yonathiae]|uniref:A24 family peptidase n=1 Tax=Corynebacterium yonathiae TaxID=2913504 RepID=A0A9X3LVS5_9CORY|nr:A24 family peptidase [Corynebacterium sp. BWA136]MCZ9295122.1 A24 family peptidase [Corynebacterium yonathiae]MDK2582621.1 A24 family peptidase [Corynebacterium sp. BWA136]